MSSNFKLFEAFKDKDFITDLTLCRVLAEDKEFPWVLLIPRRDNIKQMNQLCRDDRLQLMEEITIASNIMEKLFPTHMLNVAAIGNKTPQLHIHIISRNKSDSLWPEVVWGRKIQKLSDSEKSERLNKIKGAFEII